MDSQKDMPTRYGSPIYEEEPAFGPDATCIAALRAAGALILGKTHTTEFAATTVGGPCANPRSLDTPEGSSSESAAAVRTPGGSSSGSAAAVADYQSPLAIGTQTGGSVVRPGAFCGIYSFKVTVPSPYNGALKANLEKPTWNIVSTEGMCRNSINLDTVGYFARDPEDLELLASFFSQSSSGPLPAPVPTLQPGVTKIALLKTHVWHKAGPGLRSAWNQLSDLLTSQGTVMDLELPPTFSAHPEYHSTLLAGEAYSSFLGHYLSSPSKLGAKIHQLIQQGARITDLRRTHDNCASLRVQWDAIASEYDLVITPSVVDEAPIGLDYTGDASFCSLWTLLHAPVVNVPGLNGKHGLPIGISVVGARWTDEEVLRKAKVIGDILRQA